MCKRMSISVLYLNKRRGAHPQQLPKRQLSKPQPLEDAVKSANNVNPETSSLVRAAKNIGIAFGD